jgi:hypothetical protein
LKVRPMINTREREPEMVWPLRIMAFTD